VPKRTRSILAKRFLVIAYKYSEPFEQGWFPVDNAY
jgi:hypothetical protein